MIDDKGKPNNGPFRTTNTCVMLKTNSQSADFRLDYYLYGQFMKFIERGSIRVDVGPPDAECPVVGFKNPDGELVVVVVNLRKISRAVAIEVGDSRALTVLAPRSVTTVVWRPKIK